MTRISVNKIANSKIDGYNVGAYVIEYSCFYGMDFVDIPAWYYVLLVYKNKFNFRDVMVEIREMDDAGNINQIPPEKDIEGISELNMGKLFCGNKDVNIPCTSKAVIKTLEFYNIDLTGKNATIVGRSNIVGKPLIPQLLEKNATVTICHSKTKNIEEILQKSDVVIMAIGKAITKLITLL